MWKLTCFPLWACLVIGVGGLDATPLHVPAEASVAEFQEESKTKAFYVEDAAGRALQETSNSSLSDEEVGEGVYLCPTDETVVTVGMGGRSIMLGRSSSASLCILTRVTKLEPNDDGKEEEVAVIGRSYDALPWEAVAGVFVRLAYDCKGDFCSVQLPPLADADKEAYVLRTVQRQLKSREKVARFLEQTTFGPTRAELDNWTMFEDDSELEYTFVDWLKKQMYEVPPTSHRAFWRRRSNTRVFGTEIVAPTRRVCDKFSRWRNFAFTIADKERLVEVTSLADDGGNGPPYVVSVVGQARTVVSAFRSAPGALFVFDGPGQYELCINIDHVVRGSLFVRAYGVPSAPCGRLREGNPPVSRVHLFTPQTSILNFPTAIAEGGTLLADPTIPDHGEFVVTAEIDDDLCDELPLPGTGPAAFAQVESTGEYLIYDPLLQLANNTVGEPVGDGGGAFVQASNQVTLCSNVPRTMFNEGLCHLSSSVTTCAATELPQSTLTLDSDSIRQLHTLTGRFVYAVEGLRVEDTDAVRSPCVPASRSRWIRVATTPATRTNCTSSNLDPSTVAALDMVLRSNLDPNPVIADVVFPPSRLQCHENDLTAKGMKILVRNQCWQHVHPQLLNVYDVTPFVTSGMTNSTLLSLTDLLEPASLGLHNFVFPSDQNMTAWEKTVGTFDLVGRFMDHINTDFLSEELDTLAVQEAFASETSTTRGFRPQGVGVLVCGSPNEVANDVTELVPDFHVAIGRRSVDDLKRERIAQRKSVWATVILSAEDQLRQRVAWALSQVFVISQNHIFQLQSTENFLAYYDIFVSNAFGNYRDVLREVSFSPMMGEMLTFLRSRSTEFYWHQFQKLAFADENYAREVMQLFTIGTIQLNADGTPVLDENGNEILTYTNDDILSYSRAWTGLDYHPRRGNVEVFRFNPRSYVDPMTIRPNWRDRFPKTDLKGGYLGDRVPLCTDLPPKHFLQRGARYRLLGSWPIPQLQKDPDAWVFDDSVKRIKLVPGGPLQRALCGKAAKNGGCTPAVEMVLKSDKKCTGEECDVDTLRVVEAANGIFYEYVRLPCVELSVFDGVTVSDNTRSSQLCLDKRLAGASASCCPKDDVGRRGFRECTFTGERMTFERAQSRCEAKDREICDFASVRRLGCGACCAYRGMYWTNATCHVQMKVKDDGDVALVHNPADMEVSRVVPHLRVDSRNYFRLFWKDGNFPSASSNNCGDNTCLEVADGCLCNTALTETMVFDSPPSRIEILNTLYIGAFHPRTFGKKTQYMRLMTGDKKVATYVLGGVVDMNTIFCIKDENGLPICLKNMQSTVNLVGLDGTTREFEFRNPPHFISLVDEPEVRDVQYEIEEVLDSYHYHPNLPPFVAHLMIQRMGNSNPSPRFVKAVAGAFRTGEYRWRRTVRGVKKKFTFGTGERGDLAATFAAIVLDRESRSIHLDADPTHGSLREPIVKVLGFMRSMEFKTRPENPVVRLGVMDAKVGQMAHEQPSVFSFLLPEFVPTELSNRMLVSPEATVFSSATAIGMLNGFNSLIKYGLMSCEFGFGELPFKCRKSGKFVEGSRDESATGELGFRLPDSFGADAVVDELSTLLTGGRLSRDSQKVIKTEYKKVIEVLNDTQAALRLAQQFIVATPEFHVNGIFQGRDAAERKKFVKPEPSTRPYKAVVFVMLVGGADSFNMLVPHSGCEDRIGKDLYGEYQQLRDFVALERASLWEIEANSDEQPCARFGLHPALGNVTKLYNAGEATFFSNVGIMNKPVTKFDYKDVTTIRLFTHNFMQREVRFVDANRAVLGTGVLGRAKDSLTALGFKVGAVSLSPVTEALDGRANQSPETEVVRSDRVEKYNPDPSIPGMNDIIDLKLNAASEATSGVLGEMWSSHLHRYIFQNQVLFDAVEGILVETPFPESQLGAELRQVARLIAAHEKRGKDRDVFYVSTPRFDVHNEVARAMESLMTEVDEAVGAFVTEMKRQGRFDDVVLVQVSDFGRTLTPNSGGGTDHGWGGNYFMAGGSVRGGRILGRFPEDLTDKGRQSIGRGRFAPTTSWEAVWNGVLEWMGVEGEDQLDLALPNRQAFLSQMWKKEDLFEQ